MGKVHFDKERSAYVLKYALMFVVLAFLRSFSTYVFVNPNGFAPGGVGGLASIIHYAVERSDNSTIRALSGSLFDPGIMTIILNVPLIIAAFIVLNKKFAINTTIVVLLYSGFMYLFGATHCPQYYADGNYGLMIIAALAGGACSGVSVGFMFRVNMSMGGTDIIGKIIYKHNPAANVQWWIMMCDCAIAMLSGLLGLIGLDTSADATTVLTKILSPVLYSFISLFTMSKMADIIESGLLSSLVFTIITDKSDIIAHELSGKLHRGVTITKGIGYYTGKEHNMIVCVTSKKQINRVKQIVTDCDPDAFMYITKAGEVSGKGFNKALIRLHHHDDDIIQNAIPNESATTVTNVDIVSTDTVSMEITEITTVDTTAENNQINE